MGTSCVGGKAWDRLFPTHRVAPWQSRAVMITGRNAAGLVNSHMHLDGLRGCLNGVRKWYAGPLREFDDCQGGLQANSNCHCHGQGYGYGYGCGDGDGHGDGHGHGVPSAATRVVAGQYYRNPESILYAAAIWKGGVAVIWGSFVIEGRCLSYDCSRTCRNDDDAHAALCGPGYHAA
ncbi:hypothetical protein K431DRAFT_134106 [Polychaeton citri CBS 116435]|uniref:Uncharacterized protein n=1 Tax=Polychaeton citri CBS 116435 TaxID=1314669 RepID=A0A9P4UTL1_9PEZI|nr:hypothetical protein K431DRAFT_134106 [Polychaeton citri CBS 116435]